MAERVFFSVIPDVNIEISVSWAAARTDGQTVGTYEMTGPNSELAILGKLEDGDRLVGSISPRSSVTVDPDSREAAGIPQNAHSFAFIYPMLETVTSKLLKDLKLNLYPWGFVGLVGGFAYFDEKMDVLQVNAITLTHTEKALVLVC